MKEIINKIIEKTRQNGGATIDISGKDALGLKAFAVSIKKTTVKTDKKHIKEDLEKFIQQHFIALLFTGKYYIGTWDEDSRGEIQIDITLVEPDYWKAIKVAKKNKQKAIYDLKNGITIYLK